MLLKRAARGAIRTGLRHDGVRRAVEAELKRRPTVGAVAPAEPEPRPFVDRFGASHRIEPGYRDRLKPGWRTMIDPVASRLPPTDEVVRRRARDAARTVSEAAAILEACAGGGLEGRILEIGCYDGAIAFELPRAPNTTVIASDLARYYVVQRPDGAAPTTHDIAAEQARLASIRAGARSAAGAPVDAVEFVEDDIGASTLESESFDAIVSFEVLEHIADPARAFQSMWRLLRPGGLAYHVYNPFLSVSGGHSLCTLDFPWGHGRLDRVDFERYLVERRPDDADQALRFYLENLNRMTMADLRSGMESAGLDLVALLPWLDRGLIASFEPDYLRHVQRAYPSAVLGDLLATFVTVVARKPSG